MEGPGSPGQGPDQAASLLRELSDTVDVYCGGGAKLIVLAGMGTDESDPSILRTWPQLYSDARAEAAAAGGADADRPLHPSELKGLAADYLLSDMSVLDVASLQWNTPATRGALRPARAGHVAVTIPVRSFSDQAPGLGRPPTVPAVPGPGPAAAPGLLPSVMGAPGGAGPRPAAPPAHAEAGPGSPGYVVLQALLSHVYGMRLTGHAPRPPALGSAAELTVPDVVRPGTQAVVEALVRCVGRVAWSLGARRPYVPLSLAEDVVHALLLTRNPVSLRGRPARAAVAAAVLGPLGKHARPLEGAADRMAPDTMGATGHLDERGRALFVPLTDVQKAVSRSEFQALASACLAEATRWAHPGPHHVVVQVGRLVLAPGAEVPARCERLQVVAEISALSHMTDGAPTVARRSREFAPRELGAVSVDLAWHLAGDDESGLLVEVLADMLDGEAEARVELRLVGKLAGVRGAGGDADAEVELARGAVDLAGVLAGGDVVCEDLRLSSPGGPGFAQGTISCFFAQGMSLAARLQRRTFVDGFKIVAFGGTASDPATRKPVEIGDLCVYDAEANAWAPPEDATLAHEAAPGPRVGHTAVEVQGCVYVAGGEAGGHVLGDMAMFNANEQAWEGATPDPGLVGRAGHVAVALPGAVLFGERALLLLHGGRSDGGAMFSDLTAVDVTRLQQRALLSSLGASPADFGLDGRLVSDPAFARPAVVPVELDDATGDLAPGARSGHCAALVLPGAAAPLREFADLSTMPGADRLARVAARGARGNLTVGARVYLFGGRLASGALANDLWCATVASMENDVGGEVGVSWARVATSGPTPAPREGASMVALGSRLVLTSGWAGAEAEPWVQDFFIFDTLAAQWASLAFPDAMPSGRFLHSLLLADYRAGASVFSTIHGEALRTDGGGYSVSVTAGEEIQLFIQSRDAFGAPCHRAGAAFSVTLLPRADARPGPAMEKNFTRSRSLVGPPVLGRAPSRRGAAALGRAPSRRGAGLLDRAAPEEVVESRHRLLGGGGGPAAAAAAGAGGEPVIVADVKDLGMGLYRVTVPTVVAGDFDLVVVGEDGGLLMGCPCPVAVAPGAAVPHNTVIEGPGLEPGEAGTERAVYVTLHDQLGNRVPMTERELEKVSARVVGAGEGEYTCSVGLEGGRGRVRYTLQRAGLARLAVRYANRELQGSPVALRAHAGPMVAAQSTVTGRCVGARWTAVVPAEVTVHARDRFGNGLDSGGDSVAVTAELVSADPAADVEGALAARAGQAPAAGTEATVADRGDGTYGATLSLDRVGAYAVHARVMGPRGGPLKGSPFTVRVMSGQVHVASCSLSGDGLDPARAEALPAGVPCRVRVAARDRDGNPLGGGNDRFRCWLAKAPDGRGRQTTEWSEVWSAGGGDPAHPAGPGGPGRAREVVAGETTDHGDGTYTLEFVPRGQGPFDLHVEGCSGFLGEETPLSPLPGSPFRVHVVAGAVYPPRCVAFGDGVGHSPVDTGCLCQFTVQLRDAYGNGLNIAAARSVACRVTAGGWSIPTEVKDNRNGTYTVSYLPDLSLAPAHEDASLQQLVQTAAVMLRVDVSVDGEPVQWSPFWQAVRPVGIAPSMCTLLQVPQQINAGEASLVVLQTADRHGNELSIGGYLLDAELRGHEEAFADVVDDNNGRYQIRLLAKAPGTYEVELHVTYRGEHMMGSPAKLMVTPPGLFKSGFWTGARTMDEAAANNFVMSGLGLTNAVAGQPASFEIASRRADEQTPSSSFIVEFRPAGHDGDVVFGLVEGPRKGVYTCEYCLGKSGDYILVVKLAKFTLAGCPRQISCEPDATYAPNCRVYGDGVDGDVECGAEATFFVETRDVFGNPTWHREDVIDVEVRGGKLDVFKRRGVMRVRFRKQIVRAQVERLEDNLYRCSYRVDQHGYYGIIIRYRRGEEEADGELEDGDEVDGWEMLGESPYEVEVYRPDAEGTARESSDSETGGAGRRREREVRALAAYTDAVAEQAIREARKMQLASEQDPFAERGGGGDTVDLHAKAKPKRFLANLRRLMERAPPTPPAPEVREERPESALPAKAAAALNLKSALQKTTGRGGTAEDRGGRRGIRFGGPSNDGLRSPGVLFDVAPERQTDGVFGLGTWGHVASRNKHTLGSGAGLQNLLRLESTSSSDDGGVRHGTGRISALGATKGSMAGAGWGGGGAVGGGFGGVGRSAGGVGVSLMRSKLMRALKEGG